MTTTTTNEQDEQDDELTTLENYDDLCEYVTESVTELMGQPRDDFEAEQFPKWVDDAVNNAWCEGMTIDEWVDESAALLGLNTPATGETK